MSANSSSLPKDSPPDSHSSATDSDDEKSSSSSSSIVKIDSNFHKSSSDSSFSTDTTIKSVKNQQTDDGNLSDVEDEGELVDDVKTDTLRPVPAPRKLTNPKFGESSHGFEGLRPERKQSSEFEIGSDKDDGSLQKYDKYGSPDRNFDEKSLNSFSASDMENERNSRRSTFGNEHYGHASNNKPLYLSYNNDEPESDENSHNLEKIDHYDCVPELSDRESNYTNPQSIDEDEYSKIVKSEQNFHPNNAQYDVVPDNEYKYEDVRLRKNEEINVASPSHIQPQNSTQIIQNNDEYGKITKTVKYRQSCSISQKSNKVGFEAEKKPTNWQKTVDFNGLENVEFTEAKETKETYKQGGFEKWVNILLCRNDLAQEDFEAKPVAFIELFKYGSARDKQFILLGIFFSILSGIGQPLPMLMGGLLANVMLGYAEIGNDANRDLLWNRGYLLLGLNAILGVIMVAATFAQYFFLRLACQNITITLRSKFIESILRQDAAWFDKQRFGSINSQLNERIDCIKDGIAEKIGLLFRGLSMFATTLIVAFAVNWQVTLIMLPVAPLSCLSMSFMARLTSKSAQKQATWLEKSANVLQESVINVRTVQSCNGQQQMVDKYKAILKKGRIHESSKFSKINLPFKNIQSATKNLLFITGFLMEFSSSFSIYSTPSVYFTVQFNISIIGLRRETFLFRQVLY